MVTDNHHYDRCPHIDYIKNIKLKRTFNIIYHKNKFITPTLKHFITTCKDKKSKIEKL